ncbi:MAG: DUF1801 domain-containing protein [Methanomassiliicoccales archaeon]|nr:DUF1801 domain-containing protein [Methanomassiliicoccales archaeon]
MKESNRTVDEYLAALPHEERLALEKLRKTIKSVAPEATESISYQVPVFRYQGRQLIGLGASKTHCTFFLLSTSIMKSFKEELKGYQVGKGWSGFRQMSRCLLPL